MPFRLIAMRIKYKYLEFLILTTVGAFNPFQPYVKFHGVVSRVFLLLFTHSYYSSIVMGDGVLFKSYIEKKILTKNTYIKF